MLTARTGDVPILTGNAGFSIANACGIQARRRVETALFDNRRDLAAATSISQLPNSRAAWECQAWQGKAPARTER
jgi:hypothetical protein